MSSLGLEDSVKDECSCLYWPAGVKRRLPSGAKVSLRKKEVSVSLAYIAAFRTPKLPMLGEFGITAGSGIEGAGDADRRIEGEDPNEDLRLCEVGGGFMGRANDWGVPGADGTGDPIARDDSWLTKEVRLPKSGGAGLFEDMRLAGRSILVTLLCWAKENWPSLVLRV